jgi:hypothetical protein
VANFSVTQRQPVRVLFVTCVPGPDPERVETHPRPEQKRHFFLFFIFTAPPRPLDSMLLPLMVFFSLLKRNVPFHLTPHCTGPEYRYVGIN